jgi:hypothetical protein
MSPRKRRVLSNTKASKTPESELTELLCIHFTEATGIEPSIEQKEGLREAAQWIREKQVTRSQVQKAIDILGSG